MKARHTLPEQHSRNQELKPTLVAPFGIDHAYRVERAQDATDAVRKISDVIFWAVDGGNEPLDGFAAYGLANLLLKACDEIEFSTEYLDKVKAAS